MCILSMLGYVLMAAGIAIGILVWLRRGKLTTIRYRPNDLKLYAKWKRHGSKRHGSKLQVVLKIKLYGELSTQLIEIGKPKDITFVGHIMITYIEWVVPHGMWILGCNIIDSKYRSLDTCIKEVDHQLYTNGDTLKLTIYTAIIL